MLAKGQGVPETQDAQVVEGKGIVWLVKMGDRTEPHPRKAEIWADAWDQEHVVLIVVIIS